MECSLTDTGQEPAIFRLPTELWLAIFEHLPALNVHIFDQSGRYRIGIMRNLQALQLVSRDFRNISRPLAYRHLTFHSRSLDSTERIVRFNQLLAGSDAPQASWIHTLWIWSNASHAHKGNGYSQAFTDALVNLLLTLSNLKELSCRMVTRVPEMAAISRYHARSLKKMVVTFLNHDLAKTLPLLSYFPVLQDLHLRIYGQSWGSGAYGKPEMPNLQLLVIDMRDGSQSIMAWLKQYTFPKLTMFRLVSDLHMSPHDLTDFMVIHGPRLHTFGFEGRASRVTANVFPHALNLKTVELGSTYKALFDMTQADQHPPASVTTIVLSGFGHNLGYYAKFLGSMLMMVQNMPSGSALRSFRIVESSMNFDHSPYSWRTEVDRADKRRIDVWTMFTQGAARLLALGVSVMDEEGVLLTDVLREDGVYLGEGTDNADNADDKDTKRDLST